MIRRHATSLHVALMAADALGAMLLFVVVTAAATAIRQPGAAWAAPWTRAGLDAFIMAGLYAAAWVGVLWLQDLYRLRARFSIRLEFLDIVRSATFLAVATFTALFILKLPDVSRLLLLALFISQVVLTLGSRVALRGLLAWLRAKGHNTRYVLVVGTSRAGMDLADRIERRVELGLAVIGHLIEPGTTAPRSAKASRGRPILGTIDDIEDVLHRRIVDEVVIGLGPDHVELLEPITRLCEEEGKIVRIPVPTAGLTIGGGRQESFDGMPVLSLVYGPDRAVGLLVKRMMDLGIGGAALLLLGPILAGVGLTIRAIDGPPALFRQVRVGLHGRPFRVLKFRTMVPDAEARLGELLERNELSGHAFKLSDDPRVSRTGRWLRKSSVDELPQLWNVVRGEMSLVGPRPPLPREVADYDLWHRRRLSMKPGITGLWQVSARSEEDFDRWVELDLDYIDRWSLWLDLKIILRTIPAMLQGR